MARARWTTTRVVAVAVGAALGAACRWSVLTWVATPGDFPWPVFWVNVAGSGLLGVVLAEEWTHPRARVVLHDLAGVGFCGGLTTFSTFAVEVTDLLRAERVEMALAYAAVSVVCSVAAVLVGAGLFHRVRAVSLPLEGSP